MKFEFKELHFGAVYGPEWVNIKLAQLVSILFYS